MKRGGGRQAANGWRDGGSRVDGTNAQPGYHINLAAYKFARDRVKPLQAAGRGRCKREASKGGGGGNGQRRRRGGKPPPGFPCRLLPSQLRDGVLRSSANCHGGPNA